MSIFKKQINYKPFNYNHITEPFIKAVWGAFWTHHEFGEMKSDYHDYHTAITPEEQEIVKNAALLISQCEIAVKSYWSNIGKLIPQPDIADVGAVFGGNEVVHSRAYSKILDVLGFNDDFQKILSEGVVQNRVAYLTKYVNKIYKEDRKNILYSLILFTLFTENTSLFSQFYVLLGFNRYRNVFKDISNIVAYSSKEETIHAQFGIQLFNQIVKEHPELLDDEFKERVIHEAEEAILAEDKLIEWMLKGYENEFLSEDILKTYIRIRLNESLSQIGFDTPFTVDEDLAKKCMWMEEELMLPAMTDFFYKKPIEYQKKTKNFSEESLF